MFKTFWENNKLLIQYTSVLVAVSALFLNVTAPNNVTAEKALHNFQLILLFIVSVTLTFLFIKFFFLILDFEQVVYEKLELSNMNEPISLLTLGFLGFATWHLWKFTVTIYPESLVSLMAFLHFVVGSVSISLGKAVADKFDKTGANEIKRTLIFSVTLAVLMTTWIYLLHQAVGEPQKLLIYAILLVVALSISAIGYWSVSRIYASFVRKNTGGIPGAN